MGKITAKEIRKYLGRDIVVTVRNWRSEYEITGILKEIGYCKFNVIPIDRNIKDDAYRNTFRVGECIKIREKGVKANELAGRA